jgi:hypothetical protein
MCAEDPPATELLYHELPQHYVWQTTTRSWKRRHRCGDKATGRMVSYSLMDVERYHLRLLLCYRCGRKLFEDLCTVNGVLYPTFKDAALAHRYHEDDIEWKSAWGKQSHSRCLHNRVICFQRYWYSASQIMYDLCGMNLWKPCQKTYNVTDMQVHHTQRFF